MKFFRNIYVAIFGWYTLFLIRIATKAAAKLMVMSGKDPNYVPPPPPPKYTPPNFDDVDINRAWMVDSKNRGNVWLVVDGYYVHHPETHPILKLRTKWEEKLKAVAEKLATAKAANVQEAIVEAATIPTVKEILVAADKMEREQKMEVGSDTINALRTAVHNVEQSVMEPEKKA